MSVIGVMRCSPLSADDVTNAQGMLNNPVVSSVNAVARLASQVSTRENVRAAATRNANMQPSCAKLIQTKSRVGGRSSKVLRIAIWANPSQP